MTEDNQDEAAPQALDLTVLELDQLLGIFISLLAAKAWQYMGIRLTPGKEETEKDLVKAAAAIDLVAIMVDKVAPFLDGRAATQIERLNVNTLKGSGRLIEARLRNAMNGARARAKFVKRQQYERGLSKIKGIINRISRSACVAYLSNI